MRDLLILFLLALIVGFSVDQYGGVTAREWNAALIALCVLSLLAYLPTRTQPFTPALSSTSSLLVISVLVYVAFQLLPLPAWALRILSPNRLEILRSLAPFHSGEWAPISVSPQLTFAQLLRLFAYLLVFFLSRDLSFRFANRVWFTAIPLLLIGALESVIVLAQHSANATNTAGTYVHHGHLAGLLEMILPLALVLIPITLDRAKRLVSESAGTAATIFFLVGFVALIMLGLLYTASRMSLAAAGISIALLAATELVSRRRQWVVILIAVAGLMLLLFSAPVNLLSRYEGGLTSEGRFQIWHATLALIAKYPVFGCGLGTFVSAVQRYRTAIPLELVDYAHNDYLQLLAELGAVGFFLVMALVVTAVRKAFWIIRNKSTRVSRLMAMGSVASIAAIAIHSTVDFQLYIPANMLVAAWIAGIVAGIGARQADVVFNDHDPSLRQLSDRDVSPSAECAR